MHVKEEVLNRRSFLMTTGLIGAGLFSGCTSNLGSGNSYLTPILNPRHYNIVTYWMDKFLQQVRDQRVAPPRAAYNMALPTMAGFLAANAIMGSYEDPYQLGPAPQGADPEVAYGVAFAKAAAEAFKQPFLFERSQFLSQYQGSEAKSLGVKWGKKVALHILKMRTGDGSENSKVNYYLGRYKRRDDALQWTPTGPLYSAAPGPAFGSFSRPLFPGHGKIKPWTMGRTQSFRVEPFYDPRSKEFAEEYDMVRHIGGADSTIRTKNEEEIALFWEDGPWGITPPGHFALIAIQVLQNRGLSFIEWARAMALIGATQADASICAWDNKYLYDVIRPETAIRHRAKQFRNPDPRVKRQNKWRSFLPTPEFPSYTSGHSTFGAAAAQMIVNIYGTDRISFAHAPPDQVIWPQLRGVARHWNRISDAAEENGMSRIYGGVHWRADHDAAMKAGRAIANNAYQKYFRPRGSV